MSVSQQNIKGASVKIRGVLLPAGQIVEDAKREMDIQIHELSMIASFQKNSRQKYDSLSNQQRALLRLSPSIQALLHLQEDASFPSAFSTLFGPWTSAVQNYQDNISQFDTFDTAVSELALLRDKTRLLERAVDRELKLQLLHVDESTSRYLGFFAIAIALAFLASAFFAGLIQQWTRPLKTINNILGQADEKSKTLPSYVGGGINSVPHEVFELSETLREYLLLFEKQEKQLKHREESLDESQRALVTLFAALSHLLRYNQQLIDELIRKERLASMSEIAAQLAHEIRNPLNSMSLKLEMLREDLNDKDGELVDRVLEEIDRLDALTESHLSQTREHLKHTWPILLQASDNTQLQPLFDEVKTLLRENLDKRSIQFKIKYDSSIENIKEELPIPKNIMKSALINLLKNAMEAIETRASTEDSFEKRIELYALRAVGPTGKEWTIRVMDTGCGFPEEFKNQPIEAFRTNKATGSGLGLVTTQKMLEAYNGQVFLSQAYEPFKTSWTLSLSQNLSQRKSRTSDKLGLGKNAAEAPIAEELKGDKA